MDLTDLELVAAVADYGGFTVAADAIGMSQPALSKRVARLEHELGVRLFHRVGRGVRLTPAGDAFLVPARQALHDVEVTRASVAAVAGLRSGELDIAALPTLAVSHLADLVGAFRVAYPEVVVRIIGSEDAAGVAALVRTARCEIGVCDLPVPGLVTWPWFRQELLAVFPPGTRLRSRRRLPVADLAAHPVVMATPGTSTRTLVEELFAGIDTTPKVAVETNLRDALIPLTLAGAGVTFVSMPLAEDAARRGAVVAHIDPPPTRTIGVLTRRGVQTPAATALLGLVRQGVSRALS